MPYLKGAYKKDLYLSIVGHVEIRQVVMFLNKKRLDFDWIQGRNFLP